MVTVSDGSTDGSADQVESLGFRVVRVPGPNGPSWARNQGARVATGDVLFFVDADTELDPTAIAKVQDLFGQGSDITAAIGSYDDEPVEKNFLSMYKNLLQHYVHQNAKEEGFTFWGACGAIRRETFLELGGFDEAYTRPCIEDIELGYRIVAAGYRIRLCKDLWVKHLKRWTAASLLRSDVLCRAIPWTRLILRSGRLENDLNIDVMTRLKVLLIGGAVVSGGVAIVWPPALLGVVPLIGLVALLDAPLLRFFAKKRGALFAAGAFGWHCFYYLYSGVAFGIGLAQHLLDGSPKSAQQILPKRTSLETTLSEKS